MNKRITYRYVWRWWPWPHREFVGSLDLSSGPMTPKESVQMATDLADVASNDEESNNRPNADDED